LLLFVAKLHQNATNRVLTFNKEQSNLAKGRIARLYSPGGSIRPTVSLQFAIACYVWGSTLKSSGVAGPLAAQGGGQICRPFALLGRPFAAKDPT